MHRFNLKILNSFFIVRGGGVFFLKKKGDTSIRLLQKVSKKGIVVTLVIIIGMKYFFI